MENEKKNNSGILVGILIGIIIMLVVVGGLFATGTIGFKTSTTSDNGQTSENNQINNNDEIKKMTKEDALLIVKEKYKKFNDFDSIFLASQFCGDSELNNPTGDVIWYVKSKQFKSKEEAYNYYNTFVSRELIDKKVEELESGITKNEQFPSAILEKDGSLYCWCKATGGFNYQIIDDKTTYEITEVTSNKIEFTGNITKYEGYETADDVGQPYNIEATLELINNNWIITKNIKK